MSTSRTELADAIPRRPRVTWWMTVVFAAVFGRVVLATSMADRWLGTYTLTAGEPAAFTVRIPALAGLQTADERLANGSVVITRGEVATPSDVSRVAAVAAAIPRGGLPWAVLFFVPAALAALFSHHSRRSTHGKLVRVQLVSLAAICVLAIGVKALLLLTPVSVLVVPVALLAFVCTLALDRVVGIATGMLAALVVSLIGPFDVGTALVLLVQATVAGLVVDEKTTAYFRAIIPAGLLVTVATVGTYLLLSYLTTGGLPAFGALDGPWVAALLGAALATLLAVPCVPLYQRAVGEITRGQLIALENLSNPLLKQIQDKAKGSWAHSRAMADLAESAANAIGANQRLVRVGALYHDLGKSLAPKFFIENLEQGETSPHDSLGPDESCDRIFAHVTEGIVTAREEGLHERIVDFMHMHHGNGVLEYFWGKAQEQGNPKGFSIEDFRYPGHPPQTRETALVAICDAVEAASRTLKTKDAKSISALVQRIVYGKLHLGQLDESGLSMGDLRVLGRSLEDSIKGGSHSRIEYPWQKAEQDASASEVPTGTSPRLDSLDRAPAPSAKPVPVTAHEPIKPASKPPASDDQPVRIAETKPGLVASPVATAPSVTSPPIELTTRKKQTTAPPIENKSVAAWSNEERETPPVHDKPDSPAVAQVSDERETPPIHEKPEAPGVATPSDERETPPIDKLAAPDEGEIRDSSPTLDVSLAASGSWTEKGASDAPWPELRGEPSEKLRAPLLASLAAIPPSSPVQRYATTLAPSHPPRPPAMILDENTPDHVYTDATATGIAKIAEEEILADIEEREAAANLDAADSASTNPSLLAVRSESHNDAARTDPAMPRFELPLKAPPTTIPPDSEFPPDRSKRSLAARIDTMMENDEWARETPVHSPTTAELRSLLGQPDATRLQSIDEIERLHHQAAAQARQDEEILSAAHHPRRQHNPTAEVDPDDIEAAIEIAPPARRPHTVGTVKKKSE
jgi:cyclic-di-AMP phosphodiesterase PgpH